MRAEVGYKAMSDKSKARDWFAPPQPGYAAAGDLMRVACVALVGWYHIWQQSWLSPVIRLGKLRLDMTPPVRAGYMFVDLMLVLSGFLTYLPYARQKEAAPGEFYLRRARRILPSYLFCIAVMLAAALTDPDFTDPGRLAKDLLAHLTFTQNFFVYSYTHTRLNVVLWTLAVEVQFYLILPALGPVFRRWPIQTYLAMAGAGLASIHLWTAPMADTTLYVNRLPNMLVVYANGMLAAHLYVCLAKLRKRRLLVAVIATAVCLAAAWGVFRLVADQSHVSGYDNVRLGQLERRFALSGCGAAFLLGGSLSFGPLRALMSNRVTRFLAGISFNFYIWHQWLAVQLKNWRVPPYAAPANPNMAGELPWQRDYTLVCFAAAFALAVLVTYLVEKPCARWIDKMRVRHLASGGDR